VQPVSSGATRYDSTTIAFHWAVFVLVAFQWIGAQTIDYFPRGPLRVDARSTHIVFGIVLGALLIARMVWRATGGRRLPAADSGPLQILAKATHYALYLLIIAMVSVGIFLAWTRGDSLFNVFTIPAFGGGDHALAENVQDIHADIGWAIVALVGLHAAAALFHRYVWRDGVLGRMIPGM
jgi:cytochrome b561